MRIIRDTKLWIMIDFLIIPNQLWQPSRCAPLRTTSWQQILYYSKHQRCHLGSMVVDQVDYSRVQKLGGKHLQYHLDDYACRYYVAWLQELIWPLRNSDVQSWYDINGKASLPLQVCGYVIRLWLKLYYSSQIMIHYSSNIWPRFQGCP